MSLGKLLKQHRRNLLEIALAVVLGLALGWVWDRIPSLDLRFSDQLVKIIRPLPELQQKFNSKVIGQEVTLHRDEGQVLRGYLTANREFLREVMGPTLADYLTELRRLTPVEQINQLTLAGYALWQAYLGKNFYRQGGDLTDLNDPQDGGYRYQYKYGLDGAGFATMPYELAVYLGLLKPTAAGAEFSAKGFLLHCQRTGYKDSGGRLGSNRYRLDVSDLAGLGREVLRVAQGERVRRKDLARLQPGDIVVMDDHCGIIVEINHNLYYLESGGAVGSRYKHRPVRAEVACKLLTEQNPLSVRRALPDRKDG